MLKAPIGCPNSECLFYLMRDSIRKDGTYKRAHDSRVVQRYRCSHCQKRFSHSTFEFEYRQKKRRLNNNVYKLLCSCVSQRRIAKILGVNKKTIERRLPYLGRKYRFLNQRNLGKERRSCKSGFAVVQLDDLVTKENSKLKPLTVTGLVDEKRRYIIGLEVGVIPAFGHLAKIGKKKYGIRENRHRETLEKLILKNKIYLSDNLIIKTDEHSLYPLIIKKHLPHAQHKQYKGGRGCVTGQGELKQQHWDPLFSINHTFAMLRANVNRLVRKTWCTTKSIERLRDHLEVYRYFHNSELIKTPP